MSSKEEAIERFLKKKDVVIYLNDGNVIKLSFNKQSLLCLLNIYNLKLVNELTINKIDFNNLAMAIYNNNNNIDLVFVNNNQTGTVLSIFPNKTRTKNFYNYYLGHIEHDFQINELLYNKEYAYPTLIKSGNCILNYTSKDNENMENYLKELANYNNSRLSQKNKIYIKQV